MATWNDVANYLRGKYKIAEDGGTILRLNFELSGGRSQQVLVGRSTMDAINDEFAQIASTFARVDSVDLSAVLREAGEYVVGGVVAYGDMLAVRHTVPLANLDLNEFEGPFELGAADRRRPRADVHRS